MKFNPNNYAPYPILRPNSSDYPEGNFTTTFSQEQRDNDLHVDCAFDIDEPTIQEHIKAGDVACCILIYCSATCYTEVFRSSPGDLKVSAVVYLDNLKGNIEVHPSVISVKDIALPTKTAHPEYGGATMVVAKYKQLASSVPWLFTVKPPGTIESVFRLERDNPEQSKLEDGEFDFIVEPLERHIVIKSNPKTYDAFQEIRSETALTRATVYLSALIYALGFINMDEPDENEPPDGWAVTLRERKRQLRIESDALAAQRMLGAPFSCLGEFTHREASSDE